jgi:signal transduction histidine kinase
VSFSLSASETPSPASLAGEYGQSLHEVLDEWEPQLGFRPRLSFQGPVESLPFKALENITETIHHALSNVQRHAHATETIIRVTVGADASRLLIADNGVGMAEYESAAGMKRIIELAAELGGTCEFNPVPGRGTEVVWVVPVTAY